MDLWTWPQPRYWHSSSDAYTRSSVLLPAAYNEARPPSLRVWLLCAEYARLLWSYCAATQLFSVSPIAACCLPRFRWRARYTSTDPDHRAAGRDRGSYAEGNSAANTNREIHIPLCAAVNSLLPFLQWSFLCSLGKEGPAQIEVGGRRRCPYFNNDT